MNIRHMEYAVRQIILCWQVTNILFAMCFSVIYLDISFMIY